MAAKRSRRGQPARSKPPHSAAGATLKDALSPRTRHILAGAALVVAVVLSYSPALTAGFIWDDDQYVTSNPTLDSLDGLRRMWTELGAVPQYYPMVHTTFWIEHHLWGLHAFGYHAVNIALHAANAVLLWRLLVRLQVPGAWLAAALFGLHPVEVESVAWITERKNVLSLFFALLSLSCYFRFAPTESGDSGAAREAETARAKWYVAALVLFGMALLSKTVVASMPAVVLVIVWWKRGRLTTREIVPLMPFFALGIGLGLVTVWMEKNFVGAHGGDWALTPADRLVLACRAIWFYVDKLLFPVSLSFFYPRWDVNARDASQWFYPITFAVIFGLTLYAHNRFGRGFVAALLIFVGVLTPALGFFDVYPFRFSFVADHFQYHASIALLTLLAAGAAQFAAARRRLFLAGSAAVLVGLGLLTFLQTFIYHDLEVLYADTISKNPTGWTAYSNLACYLTEQGRSDEGLELAQQALEHGPNVSEVQSNLAGFLLARAERVGATPDELGVILRHFERALELDPRNADAAKGLALALITAGRYDEAEKHVAQRLADAPRDADALFILGRIREASGRPEEAVDLYARSIRIEPHNQRALSALERLRSATPATTKPE